MTLDTKNPEKVVWDELGWKKIGGSRDYYIAPDGRVGRWLADGVYKLIRPKRHPAGYIQQNVILEKTGKRRLFMLHRLVAEAFIGPRPENYVINHKNGIKDDNRVDNLEWVSRSENSLHAYRNGLQKPKKGEEVANSKLTDDAVRIILNCRFLSNRRIADVFGVGARTVATIKNGRSWRHIYDEFKGGQLKK